MNPLRLNSILLVDDDEISNLFNKIFIGKLNLHVSVDFALNGKEAFDLLISSIETKKDLLPCLLLLDIKMPIMDGWSFLEVYEANVPQHVKDEIVIVMLTTSLDEGDELKAMKYSSIKKFIQKPLSERVFTELIATYFA
jgi:CheY-like chemotaxis protein